jgi:nitroimidazol reductase NimA-like FMN-containing flavoprotein (pyridoxamine 5'-phosphate oxidase superfamily)
MKRPSMKFWTPARYAISPLFTMVIQFRCPPFLAALGKKIYIHGASVSRMMVELEKGLDISLSVAQVDGLVLARSAFHHSMNYRSVVVFGQASLVPDKHKIEVLKAISDHLLPGRWEEVRMPNAKELKATNVLEISLDEASAKIRTGGPVDEKEDYKLDVWAGVLPLKNMAEDPIPDDQLKSGIEVPRSVLDYIQKLR